MEPGGNEGRSIRLALVQDIVPVLDEEATPPDWYGVYRAAKDVYDQPYRMLGHDIPEPFILYYWLPRIAIAIAEEGKAKAIRRKHEQKLQSEQALARRRGRGARGSSRNII